ncbi:hypothetical protein F7725_006148 [Dissostichus mawsoni]|uniref:Uncharacterized protein n=1 Tax=Dissostichus mawsoni TaxID=36200 RepID=A0A7J5YUC5_DISMA|nr:hypothetical protein F7725_006148 [Dissostichus mawsoni]
MGQKGAMWPGLPQWMQVIMGVPPMAITSSSVSSTDQSKRLSGLLEHSAGVGQRSTQVSFPNM